MTCIRIAAAGDLHADQRTRSRVEEAFGHVADAADVVLLAGDLTAHGELDEMDVVASAAAEVADCPLRVVLLHYSPTMSTLVGEPESIWTYLGTNRLDGPIQKHRPDLVLHGHAHEGTFAGSVGPVPVYNVAVHVMRRDFFVFELDTDAPDGHGARLEATV